MRRGESATCREKELDDVLQTTTVFANVSKGILASHEDLQDVFGTQDEEKICIVILNEGDYQVCHDASWSMPHHTSRAAIPGLHSIHWKSV